MFLVYSLLLPLLDLSPSSSPFYISSPSSSSSLYLSTSSSRCSALLRPPPPPSPGCLCFSPPSHWVCFHVFLLLRPQPSLRVSVGCGGSRGVTWRPAPPTPCSSGSVAAVGDSLWSLGLGSAPQGPPAPGRLHRSISWAGTVHHPCDSAPPYLLPSLALPSRASSPPDFQTKHSRLVECISSHLHNAANQSH